MAGDDTDDTALEHVVRNVLRRVTVGPDGPDVVSAGLVYAVAATAGRVRVLIDPDRIPDRDGAALAAALEPVLRSVDGIAGVVVKPKPKRLDAAGRPGAIRHVLGVHSGKGGVGKSTLAVNIACHLARTGRRVGLLDADVYGPSVPALMGVAGRLRVGSDTAMISPPIAHGVAVMSLGLLLPREKALAWRGGLVEEGMFQLLGDVDWGRLDLLVVDLPPGASDAHIAVAQATGLDAVVSVTGPSDLAADDVRRGLEFFADIAVPCLGLVENFTGLVCPACGHVAPVFGAGGAARLSRQTGLVLRASLPFSARMAGWGEAGTPAVVAKPDHACARQMAALAEALVMDLEELSP